MKIIVFTLLSLSAVSAAFSDEVSDDITDVILLVAYSEM